MAAVKVGTMKLRVRFEENNPTATAGGPGKLDNFTELLETWGFYDEEAEQGSRQNDYGEIVEANSAPLYVYHRTALMNALNNEGVESIRVIIDNRKFTISKWKRHQSLYMKFYLNEMR
jgi:hypothetical protein